MEEKEGAVVIKIDMEEGMSFEFKGWEMEEEEVVEDVNPWMPNRLLFPDYRARFIFSDTSDDSSDDDKVIMDEDSEFRRDESVAQVFEDWFNNYLGHGLSSQELRSCIQQFSSGIEHLTNSNDSDSNPNKRRCFSFHVKRKGFEESRYMERALAHQEEKRQMWMEENLCPADPDSYAAFLGNCTPLDDGRECPICLDSFEKETLASMLPCNHCFHTHCIVHWLCSFNTCPMCRIRFPNVYDKLPSLLPLDYL